MCKYVVRLPSRLKTEYELEPVLYSIWYPVIPVALIGGFQVKEIFVSDNGDAVRFLGEGGTDPIADAYNIPPCVTRALKRRIQTRERPITFTEQISGFLYIIIRQDSSV